MLNIDENIVLKKLDVSDADTIFTIVNNERAYLGKWLPFVAKTQQLTDSKAFIEAVMNTPLARLEFTFSIRKNDKLIGIIGNKHTDTLNRKTEIGYWLSETHQGQGIVTKSVKTLCNFLFQKLNFNRIEIKCAVGNTPSSNIAQKLGFTFEGIERQGEWMADQTYHDVEVYSKLRSEMEF